jgi:hypothetical protein
MILGNKQKGLSLPVTSSNVGKARSQPLMEHDKMARVQLQVGSSLDHAY